MVCLSACERNTDVAVTLSLLKLTPPGERRQLPLTVRTCIHYRAHWFVGQTARLSFILLFQLRARVFLAWQRATASHQRLRDTHEPFSVPPLHELRNWPACLVGNTRNQPAVPGQIAGLVLIMSIYGRQQRHCGQTNIPINEGMKAGCSIVRVNGTLKGRERCCRQRYMPFSVEDRISKILLSISYRAASSHRINDHKFVSHTENQSEQPTWILVLYSRIKVFAKTPDQCTREKICVYNFSFRPTTIEHTLLSMRLN